jgi:DNA-binding IclR family transcriptional regulator
MKTNSILSLKQKNASQRQASFENIERAIETLRSQGRTINIKNVLDVAGVARSTLYRYPVLLDRIRQLENDERDLVPEGQVLANTIELLQKNNVLLLQFVEQQNQIISQLVLAFRKKK